MTNGASDAYFVLPVPKGHRTDWGETFAEALEARLQALEPANVDRRRSGVRRVSGGSLLIELFVSGSEAPIEVLLWEDEAEVRFRDQRQRFELPVGLSSYTWIPEAVACVERLVTDAPTRPGASSP